MKRKCETCCYWIPMTGSGICGCGDSPMWDAPDAGPDDVCECWEAREFLLEKDEQ